MSAEHDDSCCSAPWGIHRRQFLRVAGTAAAAISTGGLLTPLHAAAPGPAGAPESLVILLYDSLSETQRQAIAFDWDYQDPQRGLLRTYIAANWRITQPPIASDFFTPDQRQMVREIFQGILQPDWHERFDQQLRDDDGGFGTNQRIALFGRPGEGKFQFVLTGRHMTIRCDGDSAEHVAFAGPIFYGHAASGFTEKPGHPGNIFWHQALAANEVFTMLDGKQRETALLPAEPTESAVGFQGTQGTLPGIAVAELSPDQRDKVQEVLRKLIEPYRQSDRDEVVACLNRQGGLDACHLSFYKQPDLGNDGIWDVWRLEGPALVWHFRGSPHVHTWVNVADDPSVPLNA